MRCSTLAIGVLATVTSMAPAVQGVPPGRFGTTNLDLLDSASTCSLRSPLTPYDRITSGLISSRANAWERWTIPEDPGIVLRIIKKRTVPGDGLAVFLSGLAAQIGRVDNRPQHMGYGHSAYGEGFRFSICRDPIKNPLLTWDMAHRVIFSLSRYMVGGTSQVVQYQAFLAGATPERDELFARGTINVVDAMR